MKKTKIEITVASHEVLVIQQRGNLNRAWCATCGKQVTVTSLTDAFRFGLTVEAVQRHAETGLFHLIGKKGGLTFVCINSLARVVSTNHVADPLANSIQKILNPSEREAH